MALCAKCRKFFPPGFVTDEKEICIFCEKDRDRIYYDFGNKVTTRDEIVNEYAQYLKEVNEKLRKKMDIPSIPESLNKDADEIRRGSNF